MHDLWLTRPDIMQMPEALGRVWKKAQKARAYRACPLKPVAST